MLPLEVVGQSSFPFLMAGKIGITSLEVPDQTSSLLMVAGKTKRFDSICYFHFNNSNFMSIYLNSKYNDVVRLGYYDTELAILTSHQGLDNSLSHPKIALCY
ncbi:unnamed protein product [Cuscuta europaea]|uniref:Uncharacterized protein n=1 Tax=Cuscuta europaea TaxID=41803 RepID=A0A9P1DYN1_CUSEU|nr:unnamed protein product [Cuscuta europaea]